MKNFLLAISCVFASCKPALRPNQNSTQSIEAIQSAGASHGAYQMGCGGTKAVAEQNAEEALAANLNALPPMMKAFFNNKSYIVKSEGEIKQICGGVLKDSQEAARVSKDVGSLDTCWIYNKETQKPDIYMVNTAQSINKRFLASTAAAFREFFSAGIRLGGVAAVDNTDLKLKEKFATLETAITKVIDALWIDLGQSSINPTAQLRKVYPNAETLNTFLFAETVDGIYCSRESWENNFQKGAPQAFSAAQEKDVGIIAVMGSPWWAADAKKAE